MRHDQQLARQTNYKYHSQAKRTYSQFLTVEGTFQLLIVYKLSF